MGKKILNINNQCNSCIGTQYDIYNSSFVFLASNSQLYPTISGILELIGTLHERVENLDISQVSKINIKCSFTQIGDVFMSINSDLTNTLNLLKLILIQKFNLNYIVSNNNCDDGSQCHKCSNCFSSNRCCGYRSDYAIVFTDIDQLLASIPLISQP